MLRKIYFDCWVHGLCVNIKLVFLNAQPVIPNGLKHLILTITAIVTRAQMAIFIDKAFGFPQLP